MRYKILEWHNNGGSEIVKIVFSSPLFIAIKVLNQNNVPQEFKGKPLI